MFRSQNTGHRTRSRVAVKSAKLGQTEGMSTLITLAVCSVLSLGIYFASFPFNGKAAWNLSSSVQSSAGAPSKRQPFQLAGVQLGMTPAEAKSVVSGLQLTGNWEGRQVGSYKLGNGAYSISFLGPRGANQAYRLSYEETFWNLPEVNLRQRLKRKFGEPAISRCNRESSKLGWKCTLRWQRSDGVALDAVTRTVKMANGVRKTRLELVAVDRHIKNRKPLIQSADLRRSSVNLRQRGSKNTYFATRLQAIARGARNQ
jgi:hypothetical protein